MCWLNDFCNAHIVEIFFFYGLGFFVLGIAVLLESGRNSALALARPMPWLAGFALIHAASEWVEMFIKIEGRVSPTPPNVLWESVRLALMILSFMWLLKFGCELLRLNRPCVVHTHNLIPVFLGVFTFGAAMAYGLLPPNSAVWIASVDAWGRYTLGLPACALTVWALLSQRDGLRNTGMREYGKDVIGAAIGFAWYGLFVGVIVPAAPFPPASVINATAFVALTGVPVQLFRMLTIVGVAYFLVRLLRVFDAESRRHLHESLERQRQFQADSATLNRDLQAAAMEMSVLYEQLRQRDEVHSHLLQRVVTAQEEERKRLARDLHDGVGQTLGGVIAGLGALQTRMERDGLPMHEQVGQMEGYTVQALEELHQLITDLRPTLLDQLGLLAALRWYANRYSEHFPISVEVKAEGAERRLPPEFEIVLFRIAQEALTNVVRHAGARQAAILLQTAAGKVRLEIRDDGRGFDPQTVFAATGNERPWGLLGMQERAALVGGTVEISSQPGQGTTVRISIPLPVSEMEQTSLARIVG